MPEFIPINYAGVLSIFDGNTRLQLLTIDSERYITPHYNIKESYDNNTLSYSIMLDIKIGKIILSHWLNDIPNLNIKETIDESRRVIYFKFQLDGYNVLVSLVQLPYCIASVLIYKNCDLIETRLFEYNVSVFLKNTNQIIRTANLLDLRNYRELYKLFNIHYANIKIILYHILKLKTVPIINLNNIGNISLLQKCLYRLRHTDNNGTQLLLNNIDLLKNNSANIPINIIDIDKKITNMQLCSLVNFSFNINRLSLIAFKSCHIEPKITLAATFLNI